MKKTFRKSGWAAVMACAAAIMSGMLLAGSHASAKTVAGSANLIANPTFANTVVRNGETAPRHWQQGAWGDAASAVFTYPVAGEDDAAAAQVSISSYAGAGEGNGAAEWYFKSVPVTDGALYSFSDWYNANADSYLMAEWTLKDGSLAYDALGTLPPTNGAWTESPAEIFTAPVNASSVTILHLIQGVGTLTVDNYDLSPYAASEDPNAFTQGMVSLTFDDGYTSQYDNALPILEDLQASGTFYVITDDVAQNGNLFATSQVSTSTVTTSTRVAWSGLYIDPTEATYEFSDSYSATVPTTLAVGYTLNGKPKSLVLGTVPAIATGTADFTFSLPAASSGAVLVQPITITHTVSGNGTLTASNPSLVEYSSYMDPAQLLALQADGDEIDSHTETHPDLTALSSADATAEISGSRAALQAWGASPVSTLAYPFGNYDASIETLVGDAGYQAARTVDVGYNDKASNPLVLKTYSVVASTTLPMVESWIDAAAANKWWLVLTFHDIDSAKVIAQNGETYGTTPQNLRAIINYLHAKDVPIETMDQGVAMLNGTASAGGN